VVEVLSRGLRASLVPRLTAVATRELEVVSALIHDTRLSCSDDTHVLSRCAKKGGALDVSALYRLVRFGGVTASFHDFVWASFAPSKAKFFAWLLV
jgi:hypothetical protein